MKKKAKNKSLIAWVSVVLVVVVLIVVVVCVLISSGQKLNESFFVSDGTKYVLTLSPGDDVISVNTNEYVPQKAYLIYFYSGDRVTDVKVYYKYDNFETVERAVKYFNEQRTNNSQIAEIDVNGDYVVIAADKALYEDMTADDAKQQVEFMEMLQNMSSTDTEE